MNKKNQKYLRRIGLILIIFGLVQLCLSAFFPLLHESAERTTMECLHGLIIPFLFLLMGTGIMLRHRATWYAGFVFISYLFSGIILQIAEFGKHADLSLPFSGVENTLICMFFFLYGLWIMRIWTNCHSYFGVHRDDRLPSRKIAGNTAKGNAVGPE